MILAVLLIVTDSEARASAQVHFPFRMQWSQVVWWKFSVWNGWETISGLVKLSIEEGRCTGTRCWSRTATGWSRTTASRSNCPSKNSSVRLACRGHAKAKTRDIKAFPIIFICCRSMFETRSCATYFEVWFNFSPNRMDPDFAKRLSRRTRDSWYESSHNYFPSWNFPKLEQPGKQQEEDSLNSVDWP